jgi:hypothetical protein
LAIDYLQNIPFAYSHRTLDHPVGEPGLNFPAQTGGQNRRTHKSALSAISPTYLGD